MHRRSIFETSIFDDIYLHELDKTNALFLKDTYVRSFAQVVNDMCREDESEKEAKLEERVCREEAIQVFTKESKEYVGGGIKLIFEELKWNKYFGGELSAITGRLVQNRQIEFLRDPQLNLFRPDYGKERLVRVPYEDFKETYECRYKSGEEVPLDWMFGEFERHS